MSRIPLMLIPEKAGKRISRPFIGIGNSLSKLFAGVKYDIELADIGMNQGEYFAVILLNGAFYFVLFFTFLFRLSCSLSKSILPSFAIFLIILAVLARYPKIIAGKKAEQLEKSLVFALKDLLLQLSSGVTLYSCLVNISHSNYGIVSEEFGKAAKSINAGTPIEQALEKMASGTGSEFLRRAIWQIVNTLKAGASLKGALRVIIDDLTIEQKGRIRDYARELNIWSLMYMLFAVAIPTIGAVLLVVLSSFAGLGISKGIFAAFILINLAMQSIIIGFAKSRRPIVNI